MSVEDAMKQAIAEFDKALHHMGDEYARLQVGRASAALVENVHVEVYGAVQPLRNIANISIPDARLIQIQPWDKSSLTPIEKAIVGIGTGLNPVNDGVVIRINIPPLTEERRADLTKIVWKLAEDAKIAVRTARQDAHNVFKKMKADNEITEDDLHSADKKLQDKVDDVNKKIEELAKSKEKDVMTV